ncbi:CidA/LrgA family protein [Breoghania sp. L-A4]|uniref:CidA/LrgA family protein n=1 Tax=Breoghania sp. L-A4 TaxID=2304600 RepID=UPI000E35DEA4|nr:CidA/LrgA family protein [Breoghania sp. L-A4]AXS40851.1 CidA/LrgA family protein [Breoghania sp. L-A4]
MIPAIALLLLCQLAGEALVRFLDIPLPGPVAGLVLLALGLVAWRNRPRKTEPPRTYDGIPKPVHDAAHAILRNLSLLFVPAAVGIVQQADVLAEHGVALIAALVVSTVAAMTVAALTFKIVRRVTDVRGDEPQP